MLDKLRRDRVAFRDAFSMPPDERPDARIPVIGALGCTLADVFDQIMRATNETQRRGLVVFAADLQPAGWPDEVRLVSLESDELTTQEGCLCCDWRSELPGKLGHLFLDVLRRRQSSVKAVVLVSGAGSADVLQQTLAHAPFLAQRYRLAYCLRLPGA